MSTKFKTLLFISVVLLSLVIAPASHAGLSARGPVDPVTTFPAWYQDSTGLSLAPCFDNNGFCTVTMADVPNPALPVAFPGNIGGEGFYFIAETTTAPDGTFYEAAIEFAWANEVIVDGDQVVFTRLRFRNRNAPAGDVTITHPYGTDTFSVAQEDVDAGRGLFRTIDIGLIGFDGPLTAQARVNPFLRNAAGLVTSPDGNIYIGNSVSPVTVTGGLNGVNSVTTTGTLNGTTNTFVLEGKVIGMSVTPTSITFPAQRADVASAPVTVTVTNLSALNAVGIGQIVSQGTNLADFTIPAANDACSNLSLAASGTCTFNVVFSGAAAGPAARTGTILIPSATADAPPVFIAPVTGIIDAVPPTVVANFPNTPTAPANVNITVTFSESMLISTITNTTFTVLENGLEIAGTVAYSDENKTASFNPAADFTFNPPAVITAQTSTFMTDLVGNPLETAVTFSFTTTEPDTIAPTIVTTNPAPNATGVATNAAITVTFSEPMLATSITGSTIQVSVGGTAVPGTVTVSGNVATFTPASALEFGTAYRVTIVASGPVDLASNALALAENQVFNFVTNFQPTAPEIVSPANGATGVARPVVLRWKPSIDQDQDTISYHLFLCNNPAFIGTAPNCIQNLSVTPVAAQANSIYYASVAGGGLLFSLFGLSFAAGFKGRKKIILMIAVLAISGLFIASCSKSDDDAPAPAPLTELTFQVDNLAPNVTYYWKLEADDGKAGVAATPVMTFTTQ